jgi:two-component system KDP operon response regulator KdpE
MLKLERHSMKKLLLVDDDPGLAKMLAPFLRELGYTVLTATSALEGLRLFFNERPNLILLDIMLPGMDGWDMASRVRELSDAPIIMLSAKNQETDKLRGFNLGVDDYVTKPFSPLELAARIEAVLHRANKAALAETKRPVIFGEITIDFEKRQVLRHGTPIDLSPTEFHLLQCLAESPNTAIAEANLRETVWGITDGSNNGYVRRYIWFLRQKLEDDPRHPRHIQTVRNFGYRLDTR